MDVLAKLRQLMAARNWTEYRLAKESGLSESTIANIYRRNNVPTVATLEAICNGFGITLSEFFADNDMVELSPELSDLFDKWIKLTPRQRNSILDLMDSIIYKD